MTTDTLTFDLRHAARSNSWLLSCRWVLYEKPNFKGEKIALDEGDVELTGPFSPPEEALQNRQEEEKKNGETEEHSEEKPTQKFIIGSIRRAVRVRRRHFSFQHTDTEG